MTQEGETQVYLHQYQKLSMGLMITDSIITRKIIKPQKQPIYQGPQSRELPERIVGGFKRLWSGN